MEGGCAKVWFTTLVILSQIFGVLAVIFMGIWMGKYQGGFDWGYKSKHIFNYHPMFMMLGMVFLYGDAILAYRVFRNEKKMLVKVLHMFVQLAAFGFAVTALVAVFKNHNDNGYYNLYSIHSWIGLGTVIMFGLQFVFGFVFYLFPQMSDGLKVAYMSSHRYWGVAIFCMAIATALMGVVERVGFVVDNYSDRTSEAYVINFMCLFMVMFGWLVTYIVQKPEYKRDPSPSEYSSHLQDESK